MFLEFLYTSEGSERTFQTDRLWLQLELMNEDIFLGSVQEMLLIRIQAGRSPPFPVISILIIRMANVLFCRALKRPSCQQATLCSATLLEHKQGMDWKNMEALEVQLFGLWPHLSQLSFCINFLLADTLVAVRMSAANKLFLSLATTSIIWLQ